MTMGVLRVLGRWGPAPAKDFGDPSSWKTGTPILSQLAHDP
jgi:hypothetical protein